jgi:isopentenyl-diphosphate Delta-isomerase
VKKKAAGEIPVELVDVVDRDDQPLAVMPLTEAIRQSLYYRLVSVLVFRPDGKLFLQKRGPKKNLYPNRFDLSATGHVQAGEARTEAAARELYEELGLRAQSLTVLDTVVGSEQTSQAFVTLFSAGRISEPPRPNPQEVAGGMFVDQAELAALVRDYRDMLTPGLVYFFEKKVLFPNQS